MENVPLKIAANTGAWGWVVASVGSIPTGVMIGMGLVVLVGGVYYCLCRGKGSDITAKELEAKAKADNAAAFLKLIESINHLTDSINRFSTLLVTTHDKKERERYLILCEDLTDQLCKLTGMKEDHFLECSDKE